MNGRSMNIKNCKQQFLLVAETEMANRQCIFQAECAVYVGIGLSLLLFSYMRACMYILGIVVSQ